MIALAVRKSRRFIAVTLIVLLSLGSVSAGITVTGADGITVTGADGVTYIGTSGITATGADGFLFFGPNGITITGADGITATGADGITATGADGFTFTGANGITATGADGITITGADGITATGADGITITGADGTTYQGDSAIIRKPDGITATGADGITATGADGITATGADARQIVYADGITATGADGLAMTATAGITVTGADGTISKIAPTGITISGADAFTVASANGITISGADSFVDTGSAINAGDDAVRNGIRSIDPELAVRLNEMTDDSNVNAIVVYHQKPTESDIATLQSIGVMGGTRYRELPMIALTASRYQMYLISHLQSVRSIYGNRTLDSTADPYMQLNGNDRVRRDNDLTKKNAGSTITGRNVTVAVLDTGLDGTHTDLQGRVVQNVKLVDAQSASAGFLEPVNVEGLPSTDQAYGHGTFVAGVIAGSGVRSGGKYSGIAPGANVVGLSAGDLNLSFVLAGYDYLLSHPALNTRVVNCSFSSNALFDTNDPVNVATKILTDRGVNVVFSAGNTGSGQHTLNPYAIAPWVISVGATDQNGKLANFSSRGDLGSSLFRPTVVAPGVSVVSLRATGANVTGTLGTIEADAHRLSGTELPHYTTASGTSFSAPQVAGAVALMLEANPNLTPSQVRNILQRTATPLPAYFQHEVGAGMLNVHAAVLQAAFPTRRMGVWRATLDRGQISFINDQTQLVSGMVLPAEGLDLSLNVPADALVASVRSAWGPMSTPSDLAFSLLDSAGTLAEANNPNRQGLTGKSEGYSLRDVAPGALRMRLSGATAGPQNAGAVLSLTRVEYPGVTDLDGLSAGTRADVHQALRTFAMTTSANRFRPNFGVTRSQLAAALVIAGRVPQYLPALPRYSDVKDSSTMIFVESAQSAPGGALFTDAATGGQFRPDDHATRLMTAVALVRAAGLQSEADAAATAPLTNISDAAQIPFGFRGYVSVALAHGLLTADDGSFRPQSSLTRAELARAIVALSKV